MCKLSTNENTVAYMCPQKGLPCEVGCWCRTFEFECFDSLMSPRMRQTLELRIFKFALQIVVRIDLSSLGGVKALKFEHAALALDFKG